MEKFILIISSVLNPILNWKAYRLQKEQFLFLKRRKLKIESELLKLSWILINGRIKYGESDLQIKLWNLGNQNILVEKAELTDSLENILQQFNITNQQRLCHIDDMSPLLFRLKVCDSSKLVNMIKAKNLKVRIWDNEGGTHICSVSYNSQN